MEFTAGLVTGLLLAAGALLWLFTAYVATDAERFRAWLEDL